MACWADLQEELRDRGLTMERYGLVPASSTVGGLLSRHHGTGRQMWDGDLRGGCIAISSTTPGTGDYGYLAAPRKASGPDMRYLFIGGEGLFGVILDASLVAWRPSEARLFSWETSPAEALLLHRRLIDMGVAPAWSVYVSKTLHVAVFGPDGLLRALERELTAFAPTHTGGRDDVAAMRTKLESDHPGRRESPAANRTHAATFSVAQLASAFDALDDAELTIFDLNRHAATVYATYPKGKAPAELPGAIAHLPHTSSLVASDDKIHWSHWSQTLKSELDRNRRLAVGP
ncbi:MAG: hypothetical protein R3E66_05930 [bacterium]